MSIIEASIAIRVPRDVIYKVTQDYAVRNEWDPYADRFDTPDGLPPVAATGRRLVLKMPVGEMQLEFAQIVPMERLVLRMVSGPSLVTRFVETWTFESRGEDVGMAALQYEIETAGGLAGTVAGRLAADFLQKAAEKRLQGLKKCCEKLSGVHKRPDPLRRKFK